MTMFLITLFLGFLGVHKFIRGETRLGWIYLFTCGLFGAGWIVDVFMAFFDMISSFTKKNKQSRPISKYSKLATADNRLRNEYDNIRFTHATKEIMLKLQELIIPGHSELIMSLKDLEKHGTHKIDRHAQIVDDCEQLINTTENAETFFSRYQLLLETLKILREFEPFFHFIGYLPSEKFDYFINEKQKYICLLVDRMYNRALIKGDSLKTEKGKLNQFIKAYDTIMNFEKQMTFETINYAKFKFSTKLNLDIEDDIIALDSAINSGIKNVFSYDDSIYPLTTASQNEIFVEERTLQDYKRDGVEQFKNICAYDDVTCEKCSEMDMQIFDVSKAKIGVNCPPFHKGCRCTTVPYYEDSNEPDDIKVARDINGKSIYIPATMRLKEYREKYLNIK